MTNQLMIFGAPEAALSQKQAASCKLAHPPQMWVSNNGGYPKPKKKIPGLVNIQKAIEKLSFMSDLPSKHGDSS